MTTRSRHHAVLLVLAGGGCLATGGLFGNAWLQSEWLSSKWLFRVPWGLAGFAAFAVIAAIALLVLVGMARSGRWVSTSWAPLRWILPCLVLAWVWLWTIDPPTLLYDAQLAFSGAAALWCAGVAWSALRPDRPRARWVRVLEILVLEISVCIVLGEIALRVTRSVAEIPLLATSGTDLDAWLRAHRLRPGYHHFGFPVNAEGMVDVETSEVLQRRHRVVALGDSFSVGVVPHHLHYTTVAESCFEDLEVYNLGVVNSGPREYRRLLELDGLAVQPELIVVALFLGNDITDARRRSSTPLKAWTDRGEILVLQVGKRLWALAAEKSLGAAIAGSGPSTASFGLSADEHLPPAEVEKRLPWLSDPLQEPPTLSVERFAYVETTRAEITLPEKAGEFREALDELRLIRETAGTVPIACLLIPDEFQVEEALWRDVEWAGIAQRAERDLPQRIVGSWLDEHGIPYVDLLPLLRAAPPLEDGSRHVYHVRDTHWNARGNRIAGEALAGLIERCGVAKRVPR
ncbi:MAG: hypothetical protein ACKVXR_01225 [Planctomycetota bacterium]